MSSQGSERQRPLHERALRQLISAALERGYFTEFLHHPERNITVDDVIHGLERSGWTLAERPEWDEVHRSYRYRIFTSDIEGDELTIILAAHPREKRIAIITAW